MHAVAVGYSWGAGWLAGLQMAEHEVQHDLLDAEAGALLAGLGAALVVVQHAPVRPGADDQLRACARQVLLRPGRLCGAGLFLGGESAPGEVREPSEEVDRQSARHIQAGCAHQRPWQHAGSTGWPGKLWHPASLPAAEGALRLQQSRLQPQLGCPACASALIEPCCEPASISMDGHQAAD